MAAVTGNRRAEVSYLDAASGDVDVVKLRPKGDAASARLLAGQVRSAILAEGLVQLLVLRLQLHAKDETFTNTLLSSGKGEMCWKTEDALSTCTFETKYCHVTTS